MCKYCKRLKQLKDLEVMRLTHIIDLWRHRDEKARKLVKKLYDKVLMVEAMSDLFVNSEVDDFLYEEWIGK